MASLSGILPSRYLMGLTSCLLLVPASAAEPSAGRLSLAWEHDLLTVTGDIPGHEIRVNYIEAYCRAGSTNRDWHETVIPHRTRLLSINDDRSIIRLECALADGARIRHTLTAGTDEVDVRIVASNPTDKRSNVHWAQPCIRVDAFTGCGSEDARDVVPAYARNCFVFLDGRLARLPTDPWARTARYTPGQVYCPRHVDRSDVNPRPLSVLTPSNGLMGCFSVNNAKILAVAFEPYQELFLGVITCLHSDFRIGGLAPGESKRIRGKVYVTTPDVDALIERYQRDFPEHAG